VQTLEKLMDEMFTHNVSEKAEEDDGGRSEPPVKRFSPLRDIHKQTKNTMVLVCE
jgi:hypothetical protein